MLLELIARFCQLPRKDCNCLKLFLIKEPFKCRSREPLFSIIDRILLETTEKN